MNVLILSNIGTINEALPFGSNSLYESTDHIVLLNYLDFESTVLGASSAWLIEFYSSWCGHCIKFAPTFKNLAKDVQGNCLFVYLPSHSLSSTLFSRLNLLVYKMKAVVKEWC